MSFGKKYISLPKDVSYLGKFKHFAKTTKRKGTMFRVFKNVNVSVIYIATWRNEEWSTKSQTFRLLVII